MKYFPNDCLAGNAFVRKQSLSYPGSIRRKDVNLGREHEGERVAVGIIAPNRPEFQSYAHHCSLCSA